MRQELKLARVGTNMEEATIVRWHKKPGEHFAAGDPLYDIETEKVTMAVEAPCAGTLIEIKVMEGENAAVGQAICTVESDEPPRPAP